MRIYEGTVEELKAAGLLGTAAPALIKGEAESAQRMVYRLRFTP